MEYPDSVDLRYAMASMYEEQGRIPAALRELTDLVNARPDDPAALNALGYTLADHSRELARARKLIERAHAAAPRNAAILDSMGWVLVPAGARRGSRRPICGLPIADDRDGDIAAHLGEVLWQLGQPRRCRAHLVRSQRRRRRQSAAQGTRGSACTGAPPRMPGRQRQCRPQ